MEMSVGSISVIDKEHGKADVCLEEKDNLMLTDVPFVSSVYVYLNVGDHVVVLMDEKRKFIIGKE